MAPQVFHPIHDTVEVVMFASRNGEERRNVIHYNYGGVVPTRPTVAQLNSLLAEVRDGIIDRQEDFTSTGTVWYQATARDIHDAVGNMASLAMTRLAAGPVDNFPGAVSHCLTKRTAIPGRSYRGRYYLFDLPEDYFNGDDMNAIYIPVVNFLAQQLLLNRVGSYFKPAVGSRLKVISTPMTAITYDLVADTQVRRGKGRGV